MRCLGTSQHLKEKFGKGYSLELRSATADTDEIKVGAKLHCTELNAWIVCRLGYRQNSVALYSRKI